MTKRIFQAICAVTAIVLLSCLVIIVAVCYGYISDGQLDQLRMQTTLVAEGVENEGIEYLRNLEAQDYRFTLVENDGTVLFDSKKNELEMGNHLEREEIREAMTDGYGESQRYSDTLTEKSMYSALLLDDGSVVRVSILQSSIFSMMIEVGQYIFLILTLTVVIALALAYRLSMNIVKPLNEINLDDPLMNEGYDELTPLLTRVHTQQTQLTKQEMELRNRQNEFETVTNNMSEGLILLNRKGTILSINDAAVELLDTNHQCVDKNILTINRNLELQEVLSKALSGGHAEKIIGIHDGRYQIDASPVLPNGEVTGVALLIFDVTERENAEQMRREFTANVSHELKTPLHSISGYAELLKSGMIRQEDVIPFSEKIYTEAQRMIQLVEDIISLSHLDEGAEGMIRADVDLFDLAKATAISLGDKAKKHSVELDVSGSKSAIIGYPQLVSVILYNLCDNAIKYNRPGGKVYINVENFKDEAVLTVRDTGIGIPAEDQPRIFERFYRVDKSHSKEVGGTGLGLSIVKHAAKVHDAKIELQSEAGVGTTITVRIPKA